MLKAQEASFWTFERLDGPIAAVEKVALASLHELDPEVRIKQSGTQLQIRIDSSIPEALILQKLQDGTGGPFRALRSHTIQQDPQANAAIAGQVLTKDAFFDLAANLTVRPDLLIEYGLPVLVINGNEQEGEAHHALIKSWLSSHPEQQSAILQTLMHNEDAE